MLCRYCLCYEGACCIDVMKVLYRCYEGDVKVLCRCCLCVMLGLSRCYEGIVCTGVVKVLNIRKIVEQNLHVVQILLKFILYMLHCIHLLDRCCYSIEVWV